MVLLLHKMLSQNLLEKLYFGIHIPTVNSQLQYISVLGDRRVIGETWSRLELPCPKENY